MHNFGPIVLSGREIFHRTPLSIAFVNLKPIKPGHVLVAPKRVVPRLAEMSEDEVSDLFQTVQRVGRVIEQHYQGTSLTVAVQDGPEAGQSVPHVHVHLVPRHKGDWPRNDDIYNALHAGEASILPASDVELHVDNEGRAARSADDMAREAATLASFFS